jgi:hypothetical protein
MSLRENYTFESNAFTKAPKHFLVIPKKPIQQLSIAEDSDEKVISSFFVVNFSCSES